MASKKPSRFQKLAEKMEEAKAEFVKLGRQFFNEELKELFDKHPKLENFSWTQYTPYFNDGDECVFSVHSWYPEVNGIDSDEDELPSELVPAQKEVGEFLSEVPDEIMKDLYGDHVKITIHRNGDVETDEYSHD